MRTLGFSTGSLARGDFHAALEMLEGSGTDAVELSALRLAELAPLVAAADSLGLARYRHVSVHAPSHFSPDEEREVVSLLSRLDPEWGIVVHPETICSFREWSAFGPRLWVENMDKRKPTGRTTEELSRVFSELPEAGLCFDIAHARQCDPSMLEAYRILRAHKDRIRQVHVSEVSSASKHSRLSFGAILDFRGVARWIPEDTPVIIESPVLPEEIGDEIERARSALDCAQLAVA
jgi:sugar phosphate isomerase/epimerase